MATKKDGSVETKAALARAQADARRKTTYAQCVMVPEGATYAIYEGRGYADVDPENCWDEWQRLRLELRRSITWGPDDR